MVRTPCGAIGPGFIYSPPDRTQKPLLGESVDCLTSADKFQPPSELAPSPRVPASAPNDARSGGLPDTWTENFAYASSRDPFELTASVQLHAAHVSKPRPV